jgi:hypothetical protein
LQASFSGVVKIGYPSRIFVSGNLGLDDFEFMKDGTVTLQAKKVILRNRVPLQRPVGEPVWVYGGIDGGVTHTEMISVDYGGVDPNAIKTSPLPNQ